MVDSIKKEQKLRLLPLDGELNTPIDCEVPESESESDYESEEYEEYEESENSEEYEEYESDECESENSENSEDQGVIQFTRRGPYPACYANRK